MQRRFVTQPFVAILEQYCRHSNQCRSNVAKLCCVKTRRCESSRATSPLYHHASRSCLCLLDRGEATPETRQAFEVAEAGTSRQFNRVFSVQSAFSSAGIRLLIKPMVITEPAVPNSGKRAAISLGLRLHPRNKLRMLNKDLSRFIHSVSRVRQN